MSLLITAFTAFGRFAVNPSVEIAAGVARELGVTWLEVEVSFYAADRLIDTLQTDPPGALVMIGVAGESAVIRAETTARNAVGGLADVRGVVRGPGLIEPGGPDAVPGGLFTGETPLPEGVAASHDAGAYLCNYLYYRAATWLPSRCGFVHVVATERCSAEEQIARVTRLLRSVAGGHSAQS